MGRRGVKSNQRRGASAVQRAKADYRSRGFGIQPMHKGADFIATKGSRTTFVEVKSHRSNDNRVESHARSPHPHLRNEQYRLMKSVRNDGDPNTSYRLYYS